MPNFVRNVLYFEKQDMPEILEGIKGWDKDIDFDKIIPVPDWLYYNCRGKMLEGLSVYRYLLGEPLEECHHARWLYELFHKKNESEKACFKRLSEDGTVNLRLGAKAYDSYREHGELDLFQWQMENWKCNEPIISAVEGNVLFFNTSWQAPIPVIEALADKYPDTNICYRWSDEDGETAGEILFKKGKKSHEFKASSKMDKDLLYDECWRYKY